MIIIPKEAFEDGGYPNMQTWEVSAPIPETHALWPDTLDTTDYYAYNGFVVLTIETIDGVETVTSYVPNVEAWEAWKAEQPEPAKPEPTTEERVSALEEENNLLKAQIAAQSDQMDFYEECIVEMAAVVYA